MKNDYLYRITWMVLALMPVISCRASEETPGLLRYPILKDFAYAEQTSLKNPDGKAFELKEILIGGKNYPCMIQKRSGKIHFYLEIPEKAQLRYRVSATGAGQLGARIVVESDFPTFLRREFSVPSPVDLRGFAGRVARVSFAAGNSESHEWIAELKWIDPMLQYPENSDMSSPGPYQNPEGLRDRQKGRNVMIFLFDAASAGHLGCYGYRRATTPVIDSLARDGILFENAVCLMPSTRPSVGSLLTGLYPDLHLTLRAETALPENFRTMAEVFQEEGYRTALFSGNPNASLGYHQGFHLVSSSHRFVLSSADDLVRNLNDWLTTVKDAPFFSYVHFREPHAPYKPPRHYLRLFTDGSEEDPVEGYREKLEARYDGSLAFADAQLGRVLEHLQALNLFNRTIIVVLADHGEAFWEHGARGHISQVYEEMIRIPLILRIPGEPSLRKIRKPELVGLLDLLPTFIDLFGFSRKGIVVNGRSWMPLLAGERDTSERFLFCRSEGADAAYALRSEQFKYIEYVNKSRPQEFYSLAKDPAEKKNLTNEYPILSGFYGVELQKTRAGIAGLSKEFQHLAPKEIVMDEQTKEELRALGYLD
jgi:arylsulfatase A-like enzyme